MRFLQTLAFILVVLSATSVQAQWLKIYHLGVGQGDCTFIVGQDKNFLTGKDVRVSMLIDAGDKMSEAKVKILYKFIKDTTEAYTNGTLDYIVTSHMHSDHVGSMTSLLKMIYQDDKLKEGLNVIDRFTFSQQYDYPEDSCWDYPMTDVVTEYLQETLTHFPNERLMCPSLMNLTDMFANLNILCLAANGEIAADRFVKPKSSSKPLVPKSENDLSFAFMINFGGFHYFTGGDIGGGGPYSNGETPLADSVVEWFTEPFHACAMKASHHGSGHSSNARFLEVFDPTMAVIPSALKSFSGTKLPVKSTLDAFTDINTDLFYTFVPSGSNYYSGTPKTFRDVNLFITKNPGYEQSIRIDITQIDRDKKTLVLKPSTKISSTVVCDKEHPDPTENELALIARANERFRKGEGPYPPQVSLPKPSVPGRPVRKALPVKKKTATHAHHH